MEKYTFILDIETEIPLRKLLGNIFTAIEEQVLNGKDSIKLDVVDENNIQGRTIIY